MDIIIVRKDHACKMCGAEILIGTKALRITEEGFQYPVRTYYHPNCGLAKVAEVASELETIVEKQGLSLVA